MEPTRITFHAEVNGLRFLVKKLGPGGLMLEGFPVGTNPFYPLAAGKGVTIQLVFTENGQRAMYPVPAVMLVLEPHYAAFALPKGIPPNFPFQKLKHVAPKAEPVPTAQPDEAEGEEMPWFEEDLRGWKPKPEPAPPPEPQPAPTESVRSERVHAPEPEPTQSWTPLPDLEATLPALHTDTAALVTTTGDTGLFPAAAPGTDTAPIELPPPLPADDNVTTKGSPRRIAFYIGLGLLLLIFLGLMLTQRGSVQSVQASLRGQVVVVPTPGPGVLAQLAVREGATVASGSLLFVLDDAEQRIEIETIEAEVAALRELVVQSEAALASVRPAEGAEVSSTTTETSTVDLQAIAARAEAARLRYEQARIEAERAQRLFDGGALTRSDLEARQTAAASALAEWQARASEGQGGGTRTTTDTRINMRLRMLQIENDLARRQAELRAAEVRLDQAQRGIAQSRMLSPQPGVVTAVLVSEGQVMRRGEPVLHIETTEQPYVMAYYPFREARLIRPGAPAVVNFPAQREQTSGYVSALGTSALGPEGARASTVSEQDLVPVRIVLQNLPPGATAGIQADVQVEVGLSTLLSGRLY